MAGRRPTPTPTLGRYLAGIFLARFVVILLLLVTVLQMLDLLNAADDVLAAPGADTRSLLRYLGLRLPELASQFTPFAALLASLFALAGLGQKNEITAMRAAGLSALGVLRPLVTAGAVIGIGLFAFHELVVTRASSTLEAWAAQDFAVREASAPGVEMRKNAWLVDGQGRRIKVARIIRQELFASGEVVYDVDNMSIYESDAHGALMTVIFAKQAKFTPSLGWRLNEVRILHLDSDAEVRESVMIWQDSEAMDASLFFVVEEVPDRLGLDRLLELVFLSPASVGGRDDLITESLHRFATALACVVLPLLGVVAGFAVPRRGTMLLRLVAGLGLGFLFFVADNFMVAMGKLGASPPLLAAFAAVFLFSLISSYLLLKLDA